MRFDKEKRTFMVKKFLENKSCARVRKAWRTKFLSSHATTNRTILCNVAKFEPTGQVGDLHPGRAADTEKREETENQLKALVSADPTLSLRKAACAVGSSYTNKQSILIDD